MPAFNSFLLHTKKKYRKTSEVKGENMHKVKSFALQFERF